MLFSIIMPVYNSELTLEKSIMSVLNQSINDFELIIINDGSTDDSLSIIEKYARLDSRINLINQQNSGPGRARNVGIEKASGKYIAFIDSDDYWEFDFLQTIIVSSRNYSSELIFVETCIEKPDGKILRNINVSSKKNLSKEQMICLQITGCLPWGMSKVISKNLLDRCNFGFSELSVGEEAVFSFELLNNAKSVSFVEKTIYHYVQYENGQHKKGDNDPWGPMVDLLSKRLQEVDEFSKYEKAINSLAIKALSICTYRCSFGNKYHVCKKMISQYHKKYLLKYNLKNFDKNALDKKSFIVYMLLCLHGYDLLIFASRIRKKKSS